MNEEDKKEPIVSGSDNDAVADESYKVIEEDSSSGSVHVSAPHTSDSNNWVSRKNIPRAIFAVSVMVIAVYALNQKSDHTDEVRKEQVVRVDKIRVGNLKKNDRDNQSAQQVREDSAQVANQALNNNRPGAYVDNSIGEPPPENKPKPAKKKRDIMDAISSVSTDMIYGGNKVDMKAAQAEYERLKKEKEKKNRKWPW